MKKHVFSVLAKKKLTHAVGKINKANLFFGAMAPGGEGGEKREEEDDDDDATEVKDEDCIPCGACQAIKSLNLDDDLDEIVIGDIL